MEKNGEIKKLQIIWVTFALHVKMFDMDVQFEKIKK